MHFWDFDEIVSRRKQDSGWVLCEYPKDIENEDEKNVQNRAFAGLFWNKQFYHYNIGKWLKGDPNFPIQRKGFVRNSNWGIFITKILSRCPINGNILGMRLGIWHSIVWVFLWLTQNSLKINWLLWRKNGICIRTDKFLLTNGILTMLIHPFTLGQLFRVFKIDEKNNGKPDLAFPWKEFFRNYYWISLGGLTEKTTTGKTFLEVDFLD